MPPRTAVGGVEDRAGTGEFDTELLEARAGDDLERVSRLVFIGVRKGFLDGTALYGGESAYPQEFVAKRNCGISGWTRTTSSLSGLAG
jgi:hypothetical protein